MPKEKVVEFGEVVLPVIHLNGSSVKGLLDQLFAVHRALDDAQNALGKATPNNRDYYVAEPSRYGFALDQHHKRLGAIIDVKLNVLDEIEALLAIQEEQRKMRHGA